MARRLARSETLLLLGAGVAGFLLSRLGRPRRQTAGVPGRLPRQATPHRVVIAGAGFGGLQAAVGLAGRSDVDLTVIDAVNHHLFQPLLYQVATAALSPSDIASPVRSLLPASPRTHVLMATVDGIDTRGSRVLCEGIEVPYDELVIATGSRVSYFGHGSWRQTAPGLKTLGDALDLRQRILATFEHAAEAKDEAERRRLLTFALVGGGPTGVEMAGSIAELVRDMLDLDYGIRRDLAQIVLIEGGPRILADFAPDLSHAAARELSELGVEIRTGMRVADIEHGAVRLGDESLAAGTIIWTAGTAATPVAKWLNVQPAHGGRVAVRPDLSVEGCPGIFVIGDAALSLGADGKPCPGLAPVAKQQGRYVARAIIRRLRGRPAQPAFVYRDYGTLATVGRGRAVVEIGRLHLTGLLAWVTWAIAHIFFLIGFRNRFMVSAQWAFAYATKQRGSRLIIGSPGARAKVALPPRPAQPPLANPG